MLTLAMVLGIVLGTTAGPVIGGLTVGTWLVIGEDAYPLAKDAVIFCAHTPSCFRKSKPRDFTRYNHLGMGM